MYEGHAVIHNKAGIHLRPSGVIMNVAKDYPGHKVSVIHGEKSTDLSSIFNLLSLALVCGAEITIQVSGPKEEDFCKKLVETFETEFDFPPR